MPAMDFLNGNAFLVIESLSKSANHLRGIAEETKLAPSTIHGILAKFAQNKMVFAKKSRNKKEFELNFSSPIIAKCISLIFILKITKCRAFSRLVNLEPKGVFLFGSANSGNVSSNSDIDLAVFFEKKPDSFKLSKIKIGMGNELKHEIDLVVLTKEKVKEMKKNDAELLNQILNKSALLWGEWPES